jgi:preprotein translocase subunit SecG
MTTLVVVLHFIAALVIIGLVLIQQGKGAAMGASFGSGASSTVFGSEGSGNFFTKSTWTIATLFFCTSLGLAVIAKHDAKISVEGPAVEQAVPVSPSVEVPVGSNAVPATETEAPAAPVSASDVPVSAPAETK